MVISATRGSRADASAWITARIQSSVTSTPSVNVMSLKEWPPPTTFTWRRAAAARSTRSTTSASDAGAARSAGMSARCLDQVACGRATALAIVDSPQGAQEDRTPADASRVTRDYATSLTNSRQEVRLGPGGWGVFNRRSGEIQLGVDMTVTYTRLTVIRASVPCPRVRTGYVWVDTRSPTSTLPEPDMSMWTRTE